MEEHCELSKLTPYNFSQKPLFKIKDVSILAISQKHL